MEQLAFESVKNWLNTNIYSYLQTSGGKILIYILMLFIFSTPVLIRHLQKLKAVVLLHWCLTSAIILRQLVFLYNYSHRHRKSNKIYNWQFFIEALQMALLRVSCQLCRFKISKVSWLSCLIRDGDKAGQCHLDE